MVSRVYTLSDITTEQQLPVATSDGAPTEARQSTPNTLLSSHPDMQVVDPTLQDCYSNHSNALCAQEQRTMPTTLLSSHPDMRVPDLTILDAIPFRSDPTVTSFPTAQPQESVQVPIDSGLSTAARVLLAGVGVAGLVLAATALKEIPDQPEVRNAGDIEVRFRHSGLDWGSGTTEYAYPLNGPEHRVDHGIQLFNRGRESNFMNIGSADDLLAYSADEAPRLLARFDHRQLSNGGQGYIDFRNTATGRVETLTIEPVQWRHASVPGGGITFSQSSISSDALFDNSRSVRSLIERLSSANPATAADNADPLVVAPIAGLKLQKSGLLERAVGRDGLVFSK